MKINRFFKFIIGLSVSAAIIAGGFVGFYIKGLPYLVSHPKTIKYAQDMTNKYTGAKLSIKNPVLHTEFSPIIDFGVKQVYLEKDGNKLLELNNFKASISLSKILSKNIIINKLVAESIYANVDEIQKIIPKTEKKETKSEWDVDIFDALLGVKNCRIIYSLNSDTLLDLKGEHIGVNNAEKGKRNVYAKVFADISRKDKHLTLSFDDSKRVYFENNHFYIYDCPIKINKSNIFINLKADKKKNLDISLFSKGLNVNDVLDFLNTQIIENQVQESLVYLNDIQGNVDFRLNIKNNNLNGVFKLNSANFKVRDVDNVPITMTKGRVLLTPDKVDLIDFQGYYDNRAQNNLSFEGSVKDYLNSIDIDITGKALVTNDFFKKHLSKMLGTNTEIKGDAPTRISFK